MIEYTVFRPCAAALMLALPTSKVVSFLRRFEVIHSSICGDRALAILARTEQSPLGILNCAGVTHCAL